jgi:hypothetical protein
VTAAGPPLAALTRRLAECPPDFLAPPHLGDEGGVQVAAVVADLMRDLGGPPLAATAAAGFERGEPNQLRTILVAAWLLHDEWFLRRGGLGTAVASLLGSGLDELAPVVAAERFVTDPDRREELARRVLAALGLRPAWEGEEQARDRLTSLDSIELRRVIAAAQEAERRSREVREAMRKKAAAEAAASYGRE